jgi:hypothetical protein
MSLSATIPIAIPVSEATVATTISIAIKTLVFTNWTLRSRTRFANFYYSDNAIFFNGFTWCDVLSARSTSAAAFFEKDFTARG